MSVIQWTHTQWVKRNKGVLLLWTRHARWICLVTYWSVGLRWRARRRPSPKVPFHVNVGTCHIMVHCARIRRWHIHILGVTNPVDRNVHFSGLWHNFPWSNFCGFTCGSKSGVLHETLNLVRIIHVTGMLWWECASSGVYIWRYSREWGETYSSVIIFFDVMM